MLETETNDFVAAGGLGRRGRLGLAMLFAVSVTATLGLGGCATTAASTSDSLNTGFGSATAHNARAQFVPPTGAQKANTYIQPNAARQQLAVRTYEEGEVELDLTATD